MAYRESGLAVMEIGGSAATAEYEEEEWEPESRFGEFAYREPDSAESGRLQKAARDEEERLRRDFRRLQGEARNEFKNERSRILRQYEERLIAAKQQYLEDAVASREKLLTNRQQARDEYEESLRNARNNYEFTVDIVKDHYQTIRRETTRVVKPDDAPPNDTVILSKREERPSTRVIERLDEEIRRIAAKKAQEEMRLGIITQTAVGQ